MFYIERSSSTGWDLMMASVEPVTLSDIRRPELEYPVNYNLPAMVGSAGMEARIRFDDVELERYKWGLVLENPADPDSFRIPGWELVVKYDWPQAARAAGSLFSCTANGPVGGQITSIGEPAPRKEHSA